MLARLRGRSGRLWGIQRLARLDADQLDALVAVARVVGREHVAPQRQAGISASAVISPLSSLRFAERIEIGPKAAIGPYCAVWGGFEAWTRIGAGALLGPGVVVIAGNHVVDGPGWVRDLGFDEHDAEVGEGAWVGANTTIVGCSVGAGAVVAANSVVIDDVPPGAIVAGAPARVIRMRRLDPEPAT